MLRNPRVGLYALYLLPDVFFQIFKSMKMRRRAERSSHLVGKFFLKLILPHFQQSAISVVNDYELLSIQQMMRHNQRPQRVFGCNAARIADHVRVSWAQSQAAFEQYPGVHAGEDGQPPPRPNS